MNALAIAAAGWLIATTTAQTPASTEQVPPPEAPAAEAAPADVTTQQEPEALPEAEGPAVAEPPPVTIPVNEEPKPKEKSLYDRLKLSGYVQGRFTWDESSRAPSVRDGFNARRARIKTTFNGDWAKLVVQIDAAPKGVTLKDAEAWLIEPWTPYKIALGVGQMKWPFGFEVPQSSSQREFPERTRAIRAFLSGERDRGARLAASFGVFQITAGVFDGNGVDYDAAFGVDNDRYKDVVGRAGVELENFSGGVSGWVGQTVRFSEDEDLGVVDRETFDRNRIGADAQLDLSLLPIGETALRAELIAGRTYFRGDSEAFGIPALGWYALLVQGIGERHAIAVRYDYFDPLAGTENEASSADATRPASTNAIGTVGVAYIHHWSKHLKGTVAYELPMTQGPTGVIDPIDNVLTLQLQAKY